jgi:hypothetical protein
MFPITIDENGQQRHHPGAIAQRITADGDIYGCVHDHDLGPSMYGAAWAAPSACLPMAGSSPIRWVFRCR